MSGAGVNGEAEPKRRDATRTRQALLDAASELFGQHGFGGTTLRDIGELAGVDASLIARYFGSKSALYIATLKHDGSKHPDGDSDHSILDRFIRRTVKLGPSSLIHAAVTPASSDEVRNAAAGVLDARVVSRFEAAAAETGGDDVRLRAEAAAAVVAGIALCRSAGVFGELAAADHDEVVALAERAVAALLDN